jgi:hypoxia up-regulated 1
MDQEDDQRAQLETARNQLESYIYKCKELMWEDDIEEYTKPDELEKLKELVAELGEWLEDHMDTGTMDEFLKQKGKLFDVAGPVFSRRSEFSQRPVQIENLNKGISIAEKLTEYLKTNLTDTLITQEEFDLFQKEIKKIQDWAIEMNEKQSSLSKSDDPVLLIKDLKAKQKLLKKMVSLIDPTKRMKPKVAKKSPGYTDQELENLKKSGLSKEDIDKILTELKKKDKKNDDGGEASQAGTTAPPPPPKKSDPNLSNPVGTALPDPSEIPKENPNNHTEL